MKIIQKSLEKLFSLGSYSKPVMDPDEASRVISQKIRDSQTGYALGRLGHTEMFCLIFVIFRKYSGRVLSVPDIMSQKAKIQSGIYPANSEGVCKFVEVYVEETKLLDTLAIWGPPLEKWFTRRVCPDADLVNAHQVLNSFLLRDPWTFALKDKKVLIIHPFTESIKRQLDQRDKLFADPRVLPDFEAELLSPPVTHCNVEPDDEEWIDTLTKFCGQVSKIDFDVALVSAGSYGIPIACHIKKMNRPAVHLAGGLQLLFGIYGQRWASAEWLKPFINEYWTRPLESEKLPGYKKHEGGSYW